MEKIGEFFLNLFFKLENSTRRVECGTVFCFVLFKQSFMQASLKLSILLPLWEYRCVPPCLDVGCFIF